jgi:hypothetical protein
LRDALGAIRARGAELVVIGNGAAHFARAFREDMQLDVPLLIDPELRSYRAAGLRRGFLESLSPRVPLDALRALTRGFRQTGIQGDPFQLGGLLVIHPPDRLAYHHESRTAGDHPPIDRIVRSLE